MFPSNGLITRRPASLPRVLDGASSPASAVLSGRYDFLPPVSPRFVAFAWRYHPSARVSPARGRALPQTGILELFTRYLRPGCRRWKRQDLLRSWGTPLVLLPCSPTPAGPTHQAVTMRRRGPHSVHGRGSRIYSFRGSITRLRHWLSTLRRMGHPITTQDSLPAIGQTLPDGLDYPQGSIERFQAVSYIHPPFPSST
jgi:hypothetical protein